MNKKWLFILTFLSALGALVSYLLFDNHYWVKAGLLGHSACSINATFDCDVVSQSVYSEIAGIPLSSAALSFYLLVSLFLFKAMGSKKEEARKIVSFLSPLFFLSLLLSLTLALVSFFKVGAFCPYCIGLYVISVLLFFLTPFSFTEPPMNFKKNLTSFFERKNLSFFIFSAIFMAITLLAFKSIGEDRVQEHIKEKEFKAKLDPDNGDPSEKDIQKAVENYKEEYFKQSRISFNLSGYPSEGNPNAKVSVVEFSDFQCPYCQKAAGYLKTNLSPYFDKINFVFINYPLDSTCNPQMQRPMHQHACLAAKTALCADEKGKFWPLHDLIFQNQSKISPEAITQWALSLGLSAPELKNCVASNETQNRILDGIDAGKEASVAGTPSIFINGRRLENWTNPILLRNILEEEIKRAK